MVMPYLDYPAAARERGFDLCAVWDPAVARRIFGAAAERYLADMAEAADELRLADFGDHAGLRRVLESAVAEYRPRYLYHVGGEDTMALTYRVAEEHGLAVNSSRAIETLNDKLALRRVLAERNLSPVQFAHAAHWEEVAGLLPQFRLPVVVKPTGLSGSRGVRLVREPGELDGWGRLLAGYGYTGSVLVEEYLDGPEFSVETISVRGRHHVIGVTRKQVGEPPFFVESGHVHPEPESAATAAMAELVAATLTAAGYDTGPAHTEVKLTSRGPRVVESQARPGGDKIPRLVRLSRGFDIAGGIFDALAGNPLRPATGTGTARIHYFSLPIGVVTSVAGLDAARDLPFVHELSFPFAPGDAVPETVDWSTRHGYVVVRGDSAAHTDELVAQVERTLRVTTKTETRAGVDR